MDVEKPSNTTFFLNKDEISKISAYIYEEIQRRLGQHTNKEKILNEMLDLNKIDEILTTLDIKDNMTNREQIQQAIIILSFTFLKASDYLELLKSLKDFTGKYNSTLKTQIVRYLIPLSDIYSIDVKKWLPASYPKKWTEKRKIILDTVKEIIQRYQFRPYQDFSDHIKNEIISEILSQLRLKIPFYNEIVKYPDFMDLIEKYIIMIYLIIKRPSLSQSEIVKMSGLGHTAVKSVANSLNLKLNKSYQPLREDEIKKILELIKKEIDKFKKGMIPKSLSQLSREIGMDSSPFLYWSKKKFPEEYNKIWKKNNWFIPKKTKNLIFEVLERQIKNYRNGKQVSSLGEIARNFNVSLESVAKIARKHFKEWYDKIWGANHFLSEDMRQNLTKKIKLESKKKNPDSLSKIGRDFGTSYDVARYHAKKTLGKDAYNRTWGKSRVKNDAVLFKKLDNIINNEIKMYYDFKNDKQVVFDKFFSNFNIQNASYTPKSIMSIADSLGLGRSHVEYYVQHEYPLEYKEIWARGDDWFVSDDVKEKIIQDILDSENGLSLNQIGKKYGFNISTITRISRQDVEPHYKGFSHEKRFPVELHQRIGTQVHSIIHGLITRHLLNNNIKIFSEIPRENTNYTYDQIIPNIH